MMDGLYQKAQIAVCEGKIDEAWNLLASGFSPNESWHSKRYKFGALLWDCFRFDSASEIFNELVEDQRTDWSILQLIAKSYFSNGRFQKATDTMSQALGRCLDEKRSECLEQLAACLERNNQMKAASEAAELALKESPGSAQAVRLLAHIDKRTGDFDSAIARICKHLQQYSGVSDWQLKYELAASLDRTGQYDRAWNELVQAKAQIRDQTEPHLADSRLIRKRQGELARKITDVDLENWHQPPELDFTAKIAFMAGFPRSGTTLLEQILASHPQCVSTDESGILATQFIAPLVWEAESTIDSLIEIRSFDKEQLIEGRRCFLEFTESYIGEAIDSRLLIEKDPLLTADLALPLRLFPESSLVMPLRDPRDVILSFFFTMIPVNWKSAPATDIVKTAHFYHDCMRHWILFRNRIQSPSIETRYEDMVLSPETESRRLAEFLDLSWDASMLDEKNRSGQKAVSTPSYDDITKPIYTRAVGRWENYAQYLEPAMKIVHPYAQEFGYE